MILRNLDHALVLDKPAGMSTHTPDGGLTFGFTEVASQILDQKLWAIHRLDRDTSGCLICTNSAEAVETWGKKLKDSVKKYVFISPHEHPQSVWSLEGRIEKVGSHKFDLVEGEPNSHTTFAKIGKNRLGFIYEAEIHSGKTHQIRIHAQKSGLPILGDNEHGGAYFPRLCLHALELQINGEKTVSPPPLSFLLNKELEQHYLQLPVGEHLNALKFLISLDRRRFLVNHSQQHTNGFRIVHREWFPQWSVSIEQLGSVLQILNYSPQSFPTSLLDFITYVTKSSHWIVREMINRGKVKNINEETKLNISTSKEIPLQWQITENKIKYDLRHAQGMSAGLFLDQRNNREKLMRQSQGKKVANFFSYTCGFSVAAALGGAEEVVSVDTSSSNLQWGKDNFKLNGLDPERFEFFTADALFFLEACVKRQRKFDFIILDPPTFSRSKHGVFKLAEQLPLMLKNSFLCLQKEGQLLMTFNDEDLDLALVSRMIEEACQKVGHPYVRIEKIHPPLDFEFPLERQTVLKGFWIYT